MNKTKTLTRSSSDKYVAGVCGGIAEYFGLDVNLVRVGFIVTTIFTAVPLVAYVAIALVVPSDDRLPADHGPLPV